MPAFDHDVVENYRERLEKLRRLQHDIRDVTATARTRDGGVTVTVGPRGELRDLRFEPRALQRTNAGQLARTVLALVAEATQEATGRARDMTAAFLPEELAARLRDGEEDVTAFLPDAPRTPKSPWE
ncbi:YbaB/EbfC family nucleoid-associated protein [Actinoallomurus sp. NPDC052308]|uniref:YbaB/EbfC family nucleoid-associated protein n=1 Tax=Actinoallomurus sp. NPDC052308 TaxID=3155530 RepID=UPI00343CE5AA